jgi:hypothetical protein
MGKLKSSRKVSFLIDPHCQFLDVDISIIVFTLLPSWQYFTRETWYSTKYSFFQWELQFAHKIPGISYLIRVWLKLLWTYRH